MSTTMDKVKELGITKGEAKLIEHTRRDPATDEYEYYGAIEVEGSRQMFFDEGCEEGLPDTMLDAYLTAQKSGFLPSELLEQRDEAIRLLGLALHRLAEATGERSHQYCGCTYCEVSSFLTRIKQGKP